MQIHPGEEGAPGALLKEGRTGQLGAGRGQQVQGELAWPFEDPQRGPREGLEQSGQVGMG